jgi:hypothetical protein
MIDPRQLRLPLNPEVHPSAYPLLTKTAYSALRGYLEVLERYAREHGVPVSRVEIGSFADPEEGTQQLVVAQWVGLPSQNAMEYWQRVGEAIESWVDGLPEAEADKVAEGIALEVYSDVDDAAA